MTQPYGQQPGNYGQEPGGYPQQPGGYPQSPPAGFPQPGGYPQQQGGYPQSPPAGFPQAPSYAQGAGGLPVAPTDYGEVGSSIRPGSATAAAVLAFVQGGITAITTIIGIAGISNNASDVGLAWLLLLAQVAGVILLIVGGVQLMQGKSRVLLLVGCGLELAICLFYIAVFSLIPTFGVSDVEAGKTVLILAAVFFAVMPTISLIMGAGSATSQWMRARRGY